MNSKTWQLGAQLLSVLLLCIIYYWMGYELERSQFWTLFVMYSLAFGLSCYLFKSKIQLRSLLGLSFVFKLIFLISAPELSQDFYRFIWDGMLVEHGINPYLHLPQDLMLKNEVANIPIAKLLYQNMGELSQTNFSTYPPIAQWVYSTAYNWAGDNLMLNLIYTRCFYLLAEVGIVVFAMNVLKKMLLPQKQILLFVLNPMVILESSFNLHFEVVMLAFLALSLYYLYASKIYQSALAMAGAVASKLLPLLFLPLLFTYFNKTSTLFNRNQILKFLKFIIVLTLGIALTYSFLWDSELISKNTKTLSLYFSSFEFNASVYYLLRWVGYGITGYNTISIIGKLLAILSFAFIIFLSFRQKSLSFKNLIHYMLFASTAYYFLSTTVHPWYLMLPLFLSIFTPYKYMLLWSWLAFLSYSAYGVDVVDEKLWLVAIEYIVVFAFLGFEIVQKSRFKLKSTH